MLQTWKQRLISQQVAGTLQNNYTTAKSVINSQAICTLASGFFAGVGQDLHVRVAGAISNIVTTPGTIVFQVMLGSIIAWSSGNIQLNATAHTTKPFLLDLLLTCQSVGGGTSATLLGIGRLTGVMFTKTAGQTDGANTESVITVPTTNPAPGAGFDSTAAQTIDFWAGFSIANTGNAIRVDQYSVDSEY